MLANEVLVPNVEDVEAKFIKVWDAHLLSCFQFYGMWVEQDIIENLDIVVIFKGLLALDLLRYEAKYLIGNDMLISGSNVSLDHGGRQTYRFQFAHYF